MSGGVGMPGGGRCTPKGEYSFKPVDRAMVSSYFSEANNPRNDGDGKLVNQGMFLPSSERKMEKE